MSKKDSIVPRIIPMEDSDNKQVNGDGGLLTQGKRTNPNAGRKAGVPNKVTVNIRENLQALIEGNLDGLQADLASLTPKDRLEAISRILPYIIPKKSESEVVVTNKEFIIKFD